MERTESIQKVGRIEINRMVVDAEDGAAQDVDEGAVASMAVGFMALFRGGISNHSTVLVGSLLPDGRIGPVNRLSEKVSLLSRPGQKILMASGQLATLDFSVMDQLQRHRAIVQEVDNIEEAYQHMVRAR